MLQKRRKTGEARFDFMLFSRCNEANYLWLNEKHNSIRIIKIEYLELSFLDFFLDKNVLILVTPL